MKIKIPENLAEKLPPPCPPPYPNVATQRNVFIGGVLREMKDHLPGTVTVSFFYNGDDIYSWKPLTTIVKIGLSHTTHTQEVYQLDLRTSTENPTGTCISWLRLVCVASQN